MAAPPASFNPIAQNVRDATRRPARRPQDRPSKRRRADPQHFSDDDSGPENDLDLGGVGSNKGQLMAEAMLNGRHIPHQIHSHGVANTIPRHGDRPNPHLHGADFIAALHAGVGSQEWHKRGNQEAFGAGIQAAIAYRHREQERYEHERYVRDKAQKARREKLLQQRIQFMDDVYNHHWREQALRNLRRGHDVNNAVHAYDSSDHPNSLSARLQEYVLNGTFTTSQVMDFAWRYGGKPIAKLVSTALRAVGLGSGGRVASAALEGIHSSAVARMRTVEREAERRNEQTSYSVFEALMRTTGTAALFASAAAGQAIVGGAARGAFPHLNV